MHRRIPVRSTILFKSKRSTTRLRLVRHSTSTIAAIAVDEVDVTLDIDDVDEDDYHDNEQDVNNTCSSCYLQLKPMAPSMTPPQDMPSQVFFSITVAAEDANRDSRQRGVWLLSHDEDLACSLR